MDRESTRSFFTRFKNRLNNDYGGRFLEVVLLEVIKEGLSILKIIFPAFDKDKLKNTIKIEIDIEDIFPSKGLRQIKITSI